MTKTVKNWLNNKSEFMESGVQLPAYDVEKLKAEGAKRPSWLHVGAGNLYRSFHAEIADDLADIGELQSGVVVVNMRSPFAIDEVYRPFNNDILMVTMCSDSSLKKRILASTASSIFADKSRKDDWNSLVKYFESPDLQLVTYTITEKGYLVNDEAEDPASPVSAMGITCALLLKRFEAGAFPIAMVTTDNFSQNGKKFRDSILTVANKWLEDNKVTQDFVDYVSDESKVSFPWTMIDRITPNPSTEVAAQLKDEGFVDVDIVHTPGGTGFSSFSNTEETKYFVVEDSFPNGRPKLEKAGVIMCDRETAELADTMKVTACLNPLHTCMAIFGCLLGYTRIWQMMQDEDIVDLIKHIGYDEDLPVVQDPKVLDPQNFIKELLEKRLPNKGLPDSPQRIASDTSQKIPIRFGHTINSYVEAEDKNVGDLTYIPLTIAGWLRYLIAADDNGESLEPSFDPMLEGLRNYLSNIKLGENDKNKIHEAVSPILSNKQIFVNDLFEIGLGEKIEAMFLEMLSGEGAVRKTIKKYN